MIRIQRVQNRFLRFATKQTAFYFDRYTHEYGNLRKSFGTPLMKSRFMFADMIFLYKLLNGKVDCPSMLSSIKYAPTRPTRKCYLFAGHWHRTNYGMHSLINRLSREANDISANIDFI